MSKIVVESVVKVWISVVCWVWIERLRLDRLEVKDRESVVIRFQVVAVHTVGQWLAL